MNGTLTQTFTMMTAGRAVFGSLSHGWPFAMTPRTSTRMWLAPPSSGSRIIRQASARTTSGTTYGTSSSPPKKAPQRGTCRSSEADIPSASFSATETAVNVSVTPTARVNRSSPQSAM